MLISKRTISYTTCYQNSPQNSLLWTKHHIRTPYATCRRLLPQMFASPYYNYLLFGLFVFAVLFPVTIVFSFSSFSPAQYLSTLNICDFDIRPPTLIFLGDCLTCV